MSWTLQVYDPLGTTPKATYTDVSPGGIIDGFQWKRTPYGGCNGMIFQGDASRLNIGPRDTISLQVNGVGQHWGPVVQNPISADQRVQTFQVGGERDIMGKAIFAIVSDITGGNKDLSDIADYVFLNSEIYGMSGIIPTITASGRVLTSAKLGYLPLDQIFDSLVKSGSGLDLAWAVLPNGAFTFGPVATSGSVAYTDGAFRYLPVDSRDIASKIILVRNSKTFGVSAYTYQDPLHTTYGGTKAYTYPWQISDTGAILPTTKTRLGGTETTTATIAQLNDNSTATFDQFQKTGGGICLADFGTFGFRLAFPSTMYVKSVYIKASVIQYSPGGTGLTNVPLNILSSNLGSYQTTSGSADQTIDVGAFIDYMDFYLNGDSGCDGYNIKIEEIHFVGSDLTIFQDFAKALVVLPEQTPSEIVVPGIVDPALDFTITGAPGGDIVGRPQEFEYEHKKGGTKTTVRFGMDNPDPNSRAIRFLATKLQHEGQTTARQYTDLATS